MKNKTIKFSILLLFEGLENDSKAVHSNPGVNLLILSPKERASSLYFVNYDIK